MARLTKAQQNETTRVFYGIDLRTYELALVFLHRDGRLTNHSASPSSHYVTAGRTAEGEIAIVWHIGHLISFPPGMEQADWAKKEIEALKEKAAAMKMEKARPLA